MTTNELNAVLHGGPYDDMDVRTTSLEYPMPGAGGHHIYRATDHTRRHYEYIGFRPRPSWMAA